MSLFHSKTVADQIVEELVAAGVQRIYGLTGDSLNSIADAVRRSGKIDWVHVRHEESAAFMASAEAQLTGKLAVCAASCGPGSLHLLNGLYDAHRSMAPVLALVTHIPTAQIGMGYFQETHPSRFSGNAVTIASWSLLPSRCPASCRSPCRTRSAKVEWASLSCRATSSPRSCRRTLFSTQSSRRCRSCAHQTP